MESTGSLSADELPFTLYLNQRLTFDVLASLEDGFSQFQTIETSDSSADRHDGAVRSGIGLGNLFGFFGVGIGAEHTRGGESVTGGKTTAQLVHTPASLFAKTRSILLNEGLVLPVRSPADLQDLTPGSFVEVQCTMKNNPVLSTLVAMQSLLDAMRLFQDDHTSVRTGVNRQRGKSSSGSTGAGDAPGTDLGNVQKMLRTMIELLDSPGSKDLIGEIDSGFRCVLTIDSHFFIDPSLNDILDGSFRVLGKVTRVVRQQDSPGIDLFRKSTLGRFAQMKESIQAISQMSESLGEQSEQSFEGIVHGPTMQIIPLAIFA
ncbi:MAG: hypothetical protein ACKVVT_16115 [Dehalococcoidia bacterium]